MANFRVETAFDLETCMFRVELYYPDDSAVPFVVSRPIYPSHEVQLLTL